MQNVIDTKISSQGITLDESKALRQLFDIKRDDLVVTKQFSDVLLLEETQK
jgi:hypothetical protein